MLKIISMKRITVFILFAVIVMSLFIYYNENGKKAVEKINMSLSLTEDYQTINDLQFRKLI